jgi:hypothetical protein
MTSRRIDAPRNDLLPRPNQKESWPPRRQGHALVATLCFFALVALTGARAYQAFVHADSIPAHSAPLHHRP